MNNFPLHQVILYLHPSALEDVDFEVHHDEGRIKRAHFENFTIPVWNETKLGPKKTIAEYRAISETPQFKTSYKNWYRQRKIAHGNTPEQAEAKVKRAFPDQV